MYIGIDLGGTNIAAALVDENGKIIKKVSIPTEAGQGTKAVTDGLMKVCEMILEETKAEIKSVGIGVPGMMNVETGEVIYSPNLPLNHVNITTEIKQKLGVPVYINNDANCAALGEAYAGGAKEANNAVFVTLGTGVGGGIIIDKKVYSGFNGVAGEIGHVVIAMDGRQCGCGRKGGWEAYASASGLIRTTKEYMEEDKNSKIVEGDINKVNGRTSFDAMRAGDPTAQKVVDTYIKHLAAGVVDMINIFEPEVVCIGGGISNEGEYLLKPLQAAVDAEKYTRFSDDVPQTLIKKAELGNDAGIVGAAMLGK